MLKITNLTGGLPSQEILKGFTLSVEAGTTHALMGVNGSGKSTLASILAGSPTYQVASGSITWQGSNLLEMSPEDRSHAGIFLAFQYPVAIPGVSVAQFLRLARNSHEQAAGSEVTKLAPFLKELKVAMRQLELPWSFAERAVNDGFSGGEKKRLEMLQMLILKPTLVILDEIDSGLDVDAMKLVATAVHSLKELQPETSFIIITHYNRLLKLITPDYVHMVKTGGIEKSGGPELALTIEEHGYNSVTPPHANP
ncbi:Fe-S cluster assembly ATPase SufC [soil metagenome]